MHRSFAQTARAQDDIVRTQFLKRSGGLRAAFLLSGGLKVQLNFDFVAQGEAVIFELL
jgi:hypothetical protein